MRFINQIQLLMSNGSLHFMIAELWQALGL